MVVVELAKHVGGGPERQDGPAAPADRSSKCAGYGDEETDFETFAMDLAILAYHYRCTFHDAEVIA